MLCSGVSRSVCFCSVCVGRYSHSRLFNMIYYTLDLLSDLLHSWPEILIFLHHTCCQLLQSRKSLLLIACSRFLLLFLGINFQEFGNNLAKSPDVCWVTMALICHHFWGYRSICNIEGLNDLVIDFLEIESKVKVD